MNAQGMEAVIAEVLRVHVKRHIKGCDCGWAELGKSHWDHQATVILQALTEAGTVEWGAECEGEVIRHSEKWRAKSSAAIFGGRVVSRLTLPWVAVE